MSDYRYLVFPRGKQPTTDEAAELKNLSGTLRGKFAVGTCRKTGALVVAFEAAGFDQALTGHRGFATLIEKWKGRGGRVVDRLGFVKDATALQPVQPNLWTPVDATVDQATTFGSQLAAKERAAKEAVARSLLGVQRTLDRYSALRRFAEQVPYLLIALGTLVTIVAGFYAGNRLLEGSAENRRETTVRVIDAPMDEALDRQQVRKQ